MKLKTIFWDSHGIFIKPNKIKKLISKNKIVILDTRTQLEYNEKHLIKSTLIKPVDLISEVEKRSSKLLFVIVGRGLRTHLHEVSALKRKGFKAKLIDRTLDKWDHMDMIVKGRK